MVDSLALGKPVVVIDTEINREIESNTGDQNLHRVVSAKDLRAAVQCAWEQPITNVRSRVRSWSDVASEYLEKFRETLSKEIDTKKLRQRWNTVRLVESIWRTGSR